MDPESTVIIDEPAPLKPVSEATFRKRERKLRARLLAQQFALHGTGRSFVVIVAGVEGAGKGQVVDRLCEWLDTRALEVHAFWDETDEERDRPWWWRFWRVLPPRGSGAVFFGSWYTRPIIDRAFGRSSVDDLEAMCAEIRDTERMLALDGHTIIKLWFHVDRDLQQERIEAQRKALPQEFQKVSPLAERHASRWERFVSVSQQVVSETHDALNPWHIVDASDPLARDLRVAEIIETALDAGDVVSRNSSSATEASPAAPLGNVDLTARLPKTRYRARLPELQQRVHDLGWELRARDRSVVLVFEGWDAAGKGGAIRRVTQALDARLYRTITIAAPTEEERAHHYLWRFWRHLPMRGNLTIYDRSWYGRLLVERVEGFASDAEVSRAAHEICAFESQLIEGGVAVHKFWLHISPEEQLERFREREVTPWKRHKITDEDWRNRDRWDDYVEAVNDAVAATHTEAAPWHLVPANCKRHARIEVLETVCEALEQVLQTART